MESSRSPWAPRLLAVLGVMAVGFLVWTSQQIAAPESHSPAPLPSTPADGPGLVEPTAPQQRRAPGHGRQGNARGQSGSAPSPYEISGRLKGVAPHERFLVSAIPQVGASWCAELGALPDWPTAKCDAVGDTEFHLAVTSDVQYELLVAEQSGLVRARTAPCVAGGFYEVCVDPVHWTGLLVEDAQRTPIMGAEVTVGPPRAGPVWRGSTRVDGRCDVLVPDIEGLWVSVMSADHEGFHGTMPRPTAKQLTITLHRGLTVVGTVVDAATGQPLPLATVEGGARFARSVPTDEYGRYRLIGGGGGPGGAVRAAATGYATQVVLLEQSSGVETVEFKLSPAARVTGRVVTTEGNVVRRPRMMLRQSVRTGPKFTPVTVARVGDDQGYFAFDSMHRGSGAWLRAEGDGGACCEVELAGNPAFVLDVGSIVVRRGVRISVQVTDELGRPVGQCRMKLVRTEERSLALTREAFTNAAGTASFDGLAAGRYEWACRTGAGVVQSGVLTVGDEDLALPVTLALANCIAGAISDPMLVAFGRMAVVVRKSGYDVPMGGEVSVAPDGTFRVCGLPHGEIYDLAVVALPEEGGVWPMIVGGERKGVAVGSTSVTIDVERAANLAGRVCDEEGRPLGGVVVMALFGGFGPHTAPRTITDTEGWFCLPGPAERTVDLVAGVAPGRNARLLRVLPPEGRGRLKLTGLKTSDQLLVKLPSGRK